MKSLLKVCKNPKHLALVTWALIANNPITKPIYLGLMGLDVLVSLYYVLNLLARIHSQNLMAKGPPAGNNTGINLEYFLKAEDFLGTYEDNTILWLAITCCFLGALLFILVSILIFSVSIENHQGLEKQNILKKIICLLLVCFNTFLSMPACDVIMRSFLSQSFSNPLYLTAIGYMLTALAALCLLLVLLYLVRIFILCVPAEQVPWCGPISNVLYLNQLIRIGIVGSSVLDPKGAYTIIEVAILFVLQSIMAGYRVMFAPQYVRQVDMVTKGKDFMVALILLTAILCKLLNDTYPFDLIYIILLVPFVTFGLYAFEIRRKFMILVKVKQNSLHLELEYESALYVIMTLVRDSMSDTSSNQEAFGQLMDLTQAHIESCKDVLCICGQMQSFYELMSLKHQSNSEVFALLPRERERFSKIIDDNTLEGTVSNLTNLTIKTQAADSSLKISNDLLRIQHQQENGTVGGSVTPKSKLDKRESKFLIKVNAEEVKLRFLSEVLYLFYYDIQAKFPNSFKIQLLTNYFALLYKKKEMLCVFQMRSFAKSKLSVLNKFTVLVNEQYLLNEINTITKNRLTSSNNSQDGNFNGEYFIKMNHLYKELNECIESLSSSVMDFWKVFLGQTINVDATQRLGTTISSRITKTCDIFKELDSIKLFKDYEMYFQFALVQLNILNDPVAYELYIGKMKGILEMNKLYQKNFSGGKTLDWACFTIVNANGNKFGQILQMNTSMRNFLQWNEDDVKRLRIENFMPTQIKEKHQVFMDRYNRTGQSFVLNNKVVMFFKKKNGYVYPVEFYVKFHYSGDYEYTFLAMVKPIYEMAPFQNKVKYHVDQLIFMLCDDDNGYVYEYSESCKKLLKFDKSRSSDEILIKIDDILSDFVFSDIKAQRSEREKQEVVYEATHHMNLVALKEKQNDNFLERFMRNKENTSLQLIMKTRLFEECYCGNLLRMSVVCFAPVQDQENPNSNLFFDLQEQSNPLDASQLNSKNIDGENMSEDYADDNASQSSGVSSSVGSSTIALAEFRGFHSSNNQSTPKTLKIIVQLMLALYVIITIIAGVNLGLNMGRQKQSAVDVRTLQKSYDRSNTITLNMLMLRVMLNIANGYEPTSTTLLPDRYSTYRDLQLSKIQTLQDVHKAVEGSTFSFSNDFTNFIQKQNVNLASMTDNSQVYSINHTMQIAVNLYIAKLLEINNMTQSQLKGNLQIQTLSQVLNSKGNYQPTQNEKTIYFVNQNSDQALRVQGIQYSTRFASESIQHAEANILATKITAIVSILSILLIGMLIAPLITQAETRRFRVLLFFFKIPRDLLPLMIQRCEYCQNLNDEVKYRSVKREFEKSLGIKLVNQQIDQIYNEQISNKKNIDQTRRVKVKSEDNLIPSINVSKLKQNRLKTSQQEFETPVKATQGKISDSNSLLTAFNNAQNLKLQQKEKIKEELKASARKQKEDSKKENDLSNDDYESGEDEEKEQKKVDDEEVTDESEFKKLLEIKKARIKARALRKRTEMVFLSLILILTFSVYFVIAYFLGMNTFQTASDVIPALQTIYSKISCFENVINFIRENEIRNQSITIGDQNNEVGSDYYLDFCLKQEDSYQALRKNFPAYFNEAQQYFLNMESNHFCQKIFTGDLESLQHMCQTSLQGLLSKGLTNTFYFMFQQALQQNMEFENAGKSKSRTLNFLKGLLNETNLVDIIDTQAIILEPALRVFQEKCTSSVINYSQGLLYNFLLAFVLFLCLLTLLLIVFLSVGFYRIRKSIWSTNMILKIIPIEALNKKDSIKIRDFFNT